MSSGLLITWVAYVVIFLGNQLVFPKSNPWQSRENDLLHILLQEEYGYRLQQVRLSSKSTELPFYPKMPPVPSCYMVASLSHMKTLCCSTAIHTVYYFRHFKLKIAMKIIMISLGPWGTTWSPQESQPMQCSNGWKVSQFPLQGLTPSNVNTKHSPPLSLKANDYF